MCCMQCDYYLGCEDLREQDALCCGRCGELEDCNGEHHAGQSILDDDIDDDIDDDFEDDEDDEDDDFDDEIYDEIYDEDDDEDDDDLEEDDFPASSH